MIQVPARKLLGRVAALSLVSSLSACTIAGISDSEACAQINVANEQMILMLSNLNDNRDAVRTKLRGVEEVLSELQILEPANAELASATDDYTDSLMTLVRGLYSAMDGKRTASSIQSDIADFQVAGAGLLPYCDLD